MNSIFMRLQQTVCLLLFCAVIFRPLSNPDLFWQVADGYRNVKCGGLLSGPERAMGSLAVPYFDEYAVFDVGMAALHWGGGWVALILFFGIVQITPLVMGLLRVKSGWDGLGLVFGLYFLLPRIQERPEALGQGLLFILLVLLIQESPRKWTSHWLIGGGGLRSGPICTVALSSV